MLNSQNQFKGLYKPREKNDMSIYTKTHRQRSYNANYNGFTRFYDYTLYARNTYAVYNMDI